MNEDIDALVEVVLYPLDTFFEVLGDVVGVDVVSQHVFPDNVLGPWIVTLVVLFVIKLLLDSTATDRIAPIPCWCSRSLLIVDMRSPR